jgi:hypothetical protein
MEMEAMMNSMLGSRSSRHRPNERRWSQLLPVMLVVLMSSSGPGRGAATHTPALKGAILPAEAWKRLEAGNQRFVSGGVKHPDQSAARRTEEANSQHPIAVVVGCSDSRVAPEIVFDEGSAISSSCAPRAIAWTISCWRASSTRWSTCTVG